MSSIPRHPSVTKQGNDFFINVANVTIGQNTYTEAGATTSVPGLSSTITAGALLVKDLGKTVTVDNDRYRKVQAFNSEAVDSAFYIKLNTNESNACLWARMNLQA